MGVLKACFLFAPTVCLIAADPASVEVRAPVPGGGQAVLRLQFRRGLLIETKPLPRTFLLRKVSGWAVYEDLSAEGKRWVLESLFPEDQWKRDEVIHKVRWPELESAWLLAALFMGHGQNYDKLESANPKNPEKLASGDLWRIPQKLLSPELGGSGTPPAHSQPEDDLDDDAKIAAYRALLAFDEDREGKFAAYRLRKGEALYSSVVIRYTDRVDAKEVNAFAIEIARRSGIADVRSIQPGTLIKIPAKALSAPFQPEGTVALKADQEMREEVRQTRRVDAGPKLGGLRVVLDAGHGGIDRGASGNGIWESDFVYDICCRVKLLLEENTDAQVSSTIRYPGIGFKLRDDIAAPSNSAQVLTTPPFAIDGDSPNAVSVHLRWVLANDLFSSFLKKGDAQKTLFISFHADSLHPSARGTMVYVPGASFVPSAFSLGGNRGAGVREMKKGGHASFSSREKLQGEARSRLFGEALVKSLRQSKILVHPNRAIRNVIHRDGKNFVPAVIRYNEARTKVLIEVANLTNEDDAANLRDAEFRERYAEAVVKGIRAYFKK